MRHYILLAFFSLIFAEDIKFARPLITKGRFDNPPSFTNWTGVPSFFKLVKTVLTEKKEGKLPAPEIIEKELPVVKLSNFSSNAKLYAAWLGHSTVLVHMEGATFITDPIWAARASPVPFAGAHRYRPPPMRIEDLPKLDFGLLSHDHYDHLDRSTVKKISQKFPEMRWFVPLKMKEWLLAEGISQERFITELNWGEDYKLMVQQKEFSIWCLPAQHWSQRGPLDRNKRLWSGWAVVGPTRKFYFSGDTGYCRDEFIKIGKKFGSFDLSAIPIGCYKPRWFMQAQHIGPIEALEIHKQVNSKYSLGIHWGTYEMGAYENYLAPREDLKNLMKNETGTAPFETWTAGQIWDDS